MGGPEEPPTLRSICISDGLGKVFIWWTAPWSELKYKFVPSFFVVLSALMVAYWALLDSRVGDFAAEVGAMSNSSSRGREQLLQQFGDDFPPAERALSLVVAAGFLVTAILLLLLKRPKGHSAHWCVASPFPPVTTRSSTPPLRAA